MLEGKETGWDGIGDWGVVEIGLMGCNGDVMGVMEGGLVVDWGTDGIDGGVDDGVDGLSLACRWLVDGGLMTRAVPVMGGFELLSGWQLVMRISDFDAMDIGDWRLWSCRPYCYIHI
jgi:hypothetical protein